MSAKEVRSLEEVDLPSDPTDPFADMAANRLEQDLHMVRNGLIPKKVKQRMTRYRKYLTHPGACIAIVQKYKDQVMNANDSQRASSSRASQRAEARRPPQSVEALMEEIRKFKRLPKESRGATEKERKLAMRLRDAKRARNLSDEHKAELEAMKEQEQEEQLEKSREPVEAVMKDIREMGRLPKESRGASEEERSLAEKLRDHKKRGNLSDEHKAELAAMSFKELGELEEVRLEGDPMDPFHEEAANRFEQDLLMAMNGIRPQHVLRRIARYKKYMTHPGALEMDVVQKYKEQVLEAAAASDVLPPYVAGCEIQGDALRTFSEEPIMTGPLVCHLCDDASFLYDEDFAKHKEKVHSGENEYRKRVLFLMEQAGNRPVTGQEKRIIVQNFAHFQQFSRPGAKGNTFARIREEPRREAACVLSSGRTSLNLGTC